MYSDIQEVLYSEEQIQGKIKELGELLSADYEGKNPLVICVLKGAFIFMADLVKQITSTVGNRFHGGIQLRSINEIIRRC